jgi:adenosylcobinamide-GDP ribazoletransferase
MLLAPITAVPPAVVVVLLHVAVADGPVPAYLGACLAVAVTTWWSRGLHLDGLADTADGLAAAYDRERALDVMHQGDVGPTGVATLVLVLLVQVTALGALLPSWPGCALAVVALLASRQALALACRAGMPAARPDGLGATVAGSVSTVAAVGSNLAAVVLGAALAWGGGASWYAGALVVVAAALATLIVGAVARRRFGGITGDVLGATVESAVAVGLVVGVLLA